MRCHVSFASQPSQLLAVRAPSMWKVSWKLLNGIWLITWEIETQFFARSSSHRRGCFTADDLFWSHRIFMLRSKRQEAWDERRMGCSLSVANGNKIGANEKRWKVTFKVLLHALLWLNSKTASGLIDLCYAIRSSTLRSQPTISPPTPIWCIFLFIDWVLEFVNLYLHLMMSNRELSESK